MSKIKVTFVETNCKKNGPIKQTLNIIRNMDKEAFEPSLVTVWPEDADNSMIDEYKKLGISVLSANMSKKKSVLFGKKAVGQLLEQLQPDIVQGVGMPPYRMTLGYKRAIHFVTLRNYCYEDYPDYYGKIPGTVMAFLDLNLIKKRMAVGEPFVTCSESLTKMYRSRQNMEIPYIRNGVDVSQYTKRNCDEIDNVRKKLNLPLEKTIYVYSGGFIDRKNQREAITAFLAMKKNADAVLLLLGDGTNFETLKDEFSKNTNILFRGKVSNVNEYLHVKKCYSALDDIWVLTNSDKKEFDNNLDIESKVLYNPLPKNNNISTTYEEGYVLFAGRLEREHKGLDYLIDVIKKISEEVPKLRVTIIGDGPSHSWLKAEIEKTGLKEKVNLLGTTDNVYQFYSKASVMVQTSRWEGFGMTILEAMSCGIPVVAFHNYGPDEIIRDSVDGYLVDHFDTEAFAKKVAEILKQPERRKQMGKCAIERSRDFSLEKVLPLFKRYLEEAAKEL